MHIDIRHLRALDASHRPGSNDVVVVIDVLRSFTTAACAFVRGARRIWLAEGSSAAYAFWRQRPHALLVGALPGGMTAPGFDLGNSPEAIMNAELGDRELILTTAAGVQGVLRYGIGPQIFATGLTTADATARAIAERRAQRVILLCTGRWAQRDGDEDVACADYLVAVLSGQQVDRAKFRKRVRNSDFGRSFGRADLPHLPAGDLDWACRDEALGFSMPVQRDAAGRRYLEPVWLR